MKTVKKHNEDRYIEYNEATQKYSNDFKASGYCSLSGWRLRRSLVDHIIKFIDSSRLEILDMGCNNGLTGRELCNAFKKRGVESDIEGIDFVESALEIARENFNYRSTYTSDITDKDLIDSLLGDRTYSLVHCCEVFHYINPDDYEDFFSIVSSRMRQEGYFLLVLPNVKSFSHRIVKTFTPRIYDGSFKYDYDIQYIKDLFKRFGYRIESIYGAEILTNLKINLDTCNALKQLFAYEIAVLAKKE